MFFGWGLSFVAGVRKAKTFKTLYERVRNCEVEAAGNS